MERKFANLNELIQFIDTAPIEEVDHLLESFGFEFFDKRHYNPVHETSFNQHVPSKEITMKDIQDKVHFSKATISKLLYNDTAYSYSVSKKTYKEVNDVTFLASFWEVAS